VKYQRRLQRPRHAECCVETSPFHHDAEHLVREITDSSVPHRESKTGGQDRTRININEDYEVQDWAKKFDVTSDQIREAVKAVGDSAADVEMHLKGSHATSNADAQSLAKARR
jgi:hypothetical protein